MSIEAFSNSERNDDQFWIDRRQQDAGDVMLRQALDQRTCSRINIALPLTPAETPGYPLLVNVNQRGACLWLHDAAQAQQTFTLRFRCGGQEHVLRSRVAWARHYPAADDRKHLPRTEGWLAGIEFSEGNPDTSMNDIPEAILRSGDVTVSLLKQDDHSIAPDSSRHEDVETTGLTALSDHSVDGFKAASRELVPVFAEYFSDVRVVVTRERLEISASFRAPEQTKPAQIRQPVRHANAPKQAARATAPASNEQPAAVPEPAKAVVSGTSKHSIIAMTGAAVVILGASYLGLTRLSDTTPGAPDPVVVNQNIPDWAHGLALDKSDLDDWVKVKQMFNLPDATLRTFILAIQENDKYPSAHDLHDLAKHPNETRRALSLLATAASDAAPRSFDIGALKDDLESRLMAGARFPDEAPGGRYSSLQRELYQNVVVLGVVDLLHRRQDETAVQEILAAIQAGKPKDKHQ